jgi:Uma2 family endonuclease
VIFPDLPHLPHPPRLPSAPYGTIGSNESPSANKSKGAAQREITPGRVQTMGTTAVSAENRTLLQNISWQTFKAMLREMGSDRKSRIAYDNGMLEIMTPQMPHENSNRLIEALIAVMCEELQLEIKRAGSLTLIRDDLELGGEPDSSYYLQNESLVRGKDSINLDQDPPPDLVLEVKYSQPKIDKLSLYASIGIPEFWEYNGTVLRIHILSGKKYKEVQVSPTFAPIPTREISRFIQQSKSAGEMATTRTFRAWVKAQLKVNSPQDNREMGVRSREWG